MQLPDEAIEFNYAGALIPHSEAWSPLAELQAQNFLRSERVEAVKQQLMQVRQQVGAERQMTNPPPKMLPLDSAFIDLPTKLIEQYRRKGDSSEVGRILRAANKLKDEVDRVVVLGIGGSYLGARALFEACCGNHLEIAKLLLEHGANPNAGSDSNGCCLTIGAVYYGDQAKPLQELLRPQRLTS